MTTEHTSGPADRRQLRQFGLVMAGGLIVIFGLLIPWLWGRSFPLWPWIAGAIFAATGLAFPVVLAPVFHVWMKIGHGLGWINTRIILGLVFFVIFMPVALLFGILNKDPMARRFEPERPSYRIPSTASSPKQMERPF
jgi:hypothetical protein